MKAFKTISIVMLYALLWVRVIDVSAQTNPYPCTSSSSNWTELGSFGIPGCESINYPRCLGHGGGPNNTGNGKVTNLQKITYLDGSGYSHNVLYATADKGGLYKSVDGAAWVNLTEGKNFGGRNIIGCVAVNPKNHNIIYIATGDSWGNMADKNQLEMGGYTSTTTGIFRSNDEGNTWYAVNNFSPALTLTLGESNTLRFHKLLIHPADTGTVYAAFSQDSWANGDVIGSNVTKGGIYKTTNSGASWSLWNIGNTNSIGGSGIGTVVRSLEFKPDPVNNNPNIMFAGGQQIYVSTDKGTTWSTVNISCLPGLSAYYNHVNNTAGFAFAISPAAPGRIFLSLTPGGFYGYTGSGFFLVTDDFANPCSANLINYSQYTPTLVVASPNSLGPDGVNPILFSGDVGGGIDPALIVSVDGGFTWVYIEDYWSGKFHVDLRSIVIDASNNVYLATDGGVYESTDVYGQVNRTTPIATKSTWTNLSLGLNIPQFQAIAVSQSDGRVLGGCIDNSSFLYDPIKGWNMVNHGGDAGYCAIDHNNSDILYVSSNAENMIAVNTYIDKSTDGGQSFSPSLGFLYTIYQSLGVTDNSVDAFTMHPYNSDILYVYGRNASTNQNTIYKTSDAGITWTTLGTDGSAYTIDYIAVAPSDPNTLYFSYQGGYSLRKVTYNGSSWVWSVINLPALPPNAPGVYGTYQISCIAVSPFNSQDVWISVTGYREGGGGIYRSTDGGGTWTSYNTRGLPNTFVRTLAIDKESPYGAIYAGTDAGVYYLDNTRMIWYCFSDGLPIIPINDIEIDNTEGTIYAGTDGRGMWISQLMCYTRPANVFVNNSASKTGAHTASNDIYASYTNPSTFSTLTYNSGDVARLVSQGAIDIGQGFDAYPGSQLDAYVNVVGQTCNPSARLAAKSVNLSTLYDQQNSTTTQIDEGLKLVVYPNPSPGTFNVKINLPEESISDISIYDSQGRKISSLDKKQFNQVDLSNNPEGVYLIQLSSNNKVINQKVILLK